MRAIVLVHSRKSHYRQVKAFTFCKIVPECLKVLNCPLDTAGDHHGTSLSANPVLIAITCSLKLVHHDFGFEPEGMVVAFDVGAVPA